MAITILSDRIQIGNSYLMESSTGLLFTGEVNAKTTAVITGAQGNTKGYATGMKSLPLNPSIYNSFPFAVDANASEVGSLSVNRTSGTGQSSSVSGYTSGGSFSPPGVISNTIDKFSFASDGTATDVGDLTVERQTLAGQSSLSRGYASGGSIGAPTFAYQNVIDSFPFASNANATDVGDITVSRVTAAGQSSDSYGYTSGGYSGPVSNVIDRFPFASNANASDVGDLTQARDGVTGQNSSVSGYTSGGSIPLNRSNIIDKFPFSTNANATDVGDITVARMNPSGQSSYVSGYTSGGNNPSPITQYNIIDKFPFASDSNATDVGDLTLASAVRASQQF
jgi:hypothetical protein